MKTRFDALKVALLLAIVSVGVLSLRAFAQTSSPKAQLKDPDCTPSGHVEYTLKFGKGVKIKKHYGCAFVEALRKFPKDKYNQINHKKDDADINGTEIPVPPPADQDCSKLSTYTSRLETERMTESQQLGSDELTPIGANVTYQVTSSKASDIAALLNTLAD